MRDRPRPGWGSAPAGPRPQPASIGSAPLARATRVPRPSGRDSEDGDLDVAQITLGTLTDVAYEQGDLLIDGAERLQRLQ